MKNLSNRNLGIIGLVLLILGVVTIEGFGGAADLQAASTPDEFAQVAANVGNAVYWSNLGDTLLFVPGLLMLVIAILSGLGTAVVGWQSVAKTIGIWAAWVCAGADTVENIIAFWGTGFANLNAADALTAVSPSDGLINLMGLSATVKFATLGVYAIIIIVLLIVYLVPRFSSAK